MDLFRREQADAAVPVLGVAPLEELRAEGLRFLNAAELSREARVVLDSLECLGIGVQARSQGCPVRGVPRGAPRLASSRLSQCLPG